MKSGVLGSPDQSTEERALHKDGIAHADHSSNLNKNAALAGAGAAVGAGGAYALRLSTVPILLVALNPLDLHRLDLHHRLGTPAMSQV